MLRSVRLPCALALGLVAACAAPNPAPTNQPATWRPATKPEAGEPDSKPVASTENPAASPSSAAPAAASNAASSTSEPIVARVAGQPVFVSELLEQWLYLDNFRVIEQIRNLAMSRIVVAEAKRLHVTLDPDTQSVAYEAAVSAIENEIANSEAGRKVKNLKLDTYVDRVMGLDPIRYRERLRDDATRALLGERVARAWLLQQEHAEIHVIVVGNEADVKAAEQDLAAGKSFEEVAKARSIDPSKDEGGRVTPITRGPTPLSKLAFDTETGAVGGPITDAGAWLLVRVDAKRAPLEGDWSRIGPLVERSLKERPVEPLEAKQWHVAMIERYPVDLDPFLDLVHEPSR